MLLSSPQSNHIHFFQWWTMSFTAVFFLAYDLTMPLFVLACFPSIIVSQPVFIFLTLTFWRVEAFYFVDCLSIWLVFCFLLIRFRFCILAGIAQWCCCVLHIVLGDTRLFVPVLGMVTLLTWGGYCLPGPSLVSYYLSFAVNKWFVQRYHET